MIRSHAALVPPLAAGTITYEIENLDRRLILVQWDQGPATYAFNEDLEIIGELEAVG
ncbi:MAG TPA: hypothetical protein VNL14_05245 [Candidatus Acidoferrales bacterium]|nr:hypothetical protein [Candidatus Acidoferrales bacterium]